MRSPVTLFTALLLVVLTSACGLSSDPAADVASADAQSLPPTESALSGAKEAADPPFWVENFRWDGTTAHGAIRVLNPFGDVRGRKADDDAVVVSAMIQKIGSQEKEFDIVVSDGDDALMIEVVALGPAPAGRVDLAVLVPRGYAVEATTDYGAVRMKKLPSEIHATTSSGLIYVINPVALHASTDSGVIQVQIATAPPSSVADLQSVSGQVEIYADAEAALQFDVLTDGEIRNGFAGTSGAPAEKGRLEGSTGENGTTIKVRSKSGDVQITPLM